tara:strand:- start:2029 stop:2349 length:321 start_codon:yes stop_codon:yes gene_type:complete
MTKTVRLDIRDLPRDPEHFQGQLRTQLIKMANYVRKYPNKAPSLVETLDFVKGHVEENTKLDKKAAAEAAKLEKAQKAAELAAQKEAEKLAAEQAKVEQETQKVGK